MKRIISGIFILASLTAGSSAFAQSTQTVCRNQPKPFSDEWVLEHTYTDFNQCGGGYQNMAVYRHAPAELRLNVCSGQALPPGFGVENVYTDMSKCLNQSQQPPSQLWGNVMTIANLAGFPNLKVCSSGTLPSWWRITGYESGSRCAPMNTPTSQPLAPNNVAVAESLASSCLLTVSANTVPAGGTYSFTYYGNLPAGHTAHWYGTKNGVQDANHVPFGFSSATAAYQSQSSWAGTYTRYLRIRNSIGMDICNTNTVTVNLLP